MMDEHCTKVGNYYQLPLPLKNESMIFPDHQHLAEKRLHYLQKRFLRNSKFFADDRKFIEVTLVKHYARKSIKEATKGSYGMFHITESYHPNKPKKIRVAFNCSAEYHQKKS